jgi:UDP-GlcNAc3NAcA epimerase
MKITTVIGARPQFIKAAVVSRVFREWYSGVQETIIHTGQHYDTNMSDVFFDELDIPWPDHHLGIGGGTHGQNTGRMIEAIESVLHRDKSDWVLVYGDTDSTLAAALAAVKLHIPVAHVEAGLRSFNRRMPEEINRVLTDHTANLLFTPTDTATRNLITDNIDCRKVHQVGDVMYDAALYYRARAKRPLNFDLTGDFILSTIHRAENTDNLERLTQIIGALNEIALEKPVILPLHPRTRKLLDQSKLDMRNITLIEPVSYLHMVWLLEHCNLVVTDSGGLQKEAYFFGKPCVTTRDETEWVELVEAGWNVLVGASKSSIIDMCLQNDLVRSQVNKSLYGEGDAGNKIVKLLVG